MGIFKKKEKKEDKDKLPELPKMEFPSYEPQINKIDKQEDSEEEEEIPKNYKPVMKRPVSYESSMPRRRAEVEEGKPLFIKIEKYKEAINDLENIKKRIREAEDILSELERIKQEEDKEIENWRIEVNKIKDRLMDVDRKLFEGES